MEEKFFDSISLEQQNRAAEAVQKFKTDFANRAESRNGKTRDDVKNSYTRKLEERLGSK